jgi:hypothetical protein
VAVALRTDCVDQPAVVGHRRERVELRTDWLLRPQRIPPVVVLLLRRDSSSSLRHDPPVVVLRKYFPVQVPEVAFHTDSWTAQRLPEAAGAAVLRRDCLPSGAVALPRTDWSSSTTVPHTDCC